MAILHVKQGLLCDKTIPEVRKNRRKFVDRKIGEGGRREIGLPVDKYITDHGSLAEILSLIKRIPFSAFRDDSQNSR